MKLFTCAIAASLAFASTANAEVQVSMNNGLVTIIAKDATVRQIIAEWARVGEAKVVNGERIPGGPMTIELRNVPEAQALDTLLRSAAGYLAAPRAVSAANRSHFDRIVVMPVSSAPRVAVSQPPPVFQPPQQFTPQPASAVVDDQDEERPVNVAAPGGAPNARPPVFNAFPQPQVVNPQVVNPQTGAPVQLPFNPYTTTQTMQGQAPVTTTPVPQPAYSSTPTAPFGGVAVPGMVAPAPNQQPGTAPGQITQPGQTRRPGGTN